MRSSLNFAVCCAFTVYVALYQVIGCDVGHMCQNGVNFNSVQLVVHVAYIILVYLYGHLYGWLVLLHQWLGEKSTTSVGIFSQRDSVLATQRDVQPVMMSFFIALMPLIGRQGKQTVMRQ